MDVKAGEEFGEVDAKAEEQFGERKNNQAKSQRAQVEAELRELKVGGGFW